MAQWTKVDTDRWTIRQQDDSRSYLLHDGDDLTELHVSADSVTAHHFKGAPVTDEWPLGVPGEALPDTLTYVRSMEHPELVGGSPMIGDWWDVLHAMVRAV
jgi:hypothetical protein